MDQMDQLGQDQLVKEQLQLLLQVVVVDDVEEQTVQNHRWTKLIGPEGWGRNAGPVMHH